MASIGYAIIGCGRISERHRKAIEALPDARIVAVADADSAKADAVAATTTDSPDVCSDWRTVVGRSGVDVVVVTLPTHLHCEVAVAAAEAGHHIYCEKALASSLNECRRMRNAVDANGVKLSVGQSTRFQPACVMAKRLIEQGALGEVFAVEGRFSTVAEPETRGATDSWRYRAGSAGNGHIINFGCHYIDTARYFIGQDPIAVSACVRNLFSRELISEDQFCVTTECASGGLIDISLFSSVSGTQTGHEGYTIRGTDGVLMLSPFVKAIQQVRNTRDAETIPVDPKLLEEDGFARPHRLFFDAIQSDGPVPLTAALAQVNVEWGLAAYLSSEQRRWVDIPLAETYADYQGPVRDCSIPVTRT